MNSYKRSYHPLVVFFYYSGMLSSDQVSQIPYTTRKYWDHLQHSSLFGFEWIEQYSLDQKEFHSISRYRIIFQAARICCRVAVHQTAEVTEDHLAFVQS